MSDLLRRFLPRSVRRYLLTMDAHVAHLTMRIFDLEFRLGQLEKELAQLRTLQEGDGKSPGNQADAIELQTIAIDGTELLILTSKGSWGPGFIASEMNSDEYGLRTLSFQPGDVVIDIGANLGIVSIYLAKKYPFLRIIAYEPMPATYELLRRNLALNDAANVEAHPLAVTADGGDVELWPGWTFASIFASTWAGERVAGTERIRVASTTLDSILVRNNIDHCRLLKMDCEGSEHEILHTSQSLGRIDYLSIEIHENELLEQAGYTFERLAGFLAARFPGDRLHLLRVPLGA